MLLGLETFSYHLAFAYGKMNIFEFVQRTADLGLDGVQINAEGSDLAHLGSDDPGFLRDLRAMIEGLGLYAEVDTCDTTPAHLSRVLKVCKALGANAMRVYTSVGGDVQQELKQAVTDLRQVVGLCAEYGVRIAVENHEFESSRDVLNVVHGVDSPWVGTHIDTGNSMMVWEEPLEAIEAMAPHAVSTHFKDHLVIEINGQPMVVGVPLGRGSLDLAACFRTLADKTDLERINIEVCYGYVAPFRVSQEQGYGAQLGRGCFRIQPPPYDPAVVAPYILRSLDLGAGLESHAWQNLAQMSDSDDQRRELLDLQDKAVEDSVAYVKSLNT